MSPRRPALLAIAGLAGAGAAELAADPRPAGDGDLIASAKFISGILVGGILPSPGLPMILRRLLGGPGWDPAFEVPGIEPQAAPIPTAQSSAATPSRRATFVLAGIGLLALAAKTRSKRAPRNRRWRVITVGIATRNVGTMCPEEGTVPEFKPKLTQLLPLTEASLSALEGAERTCSWPQAEAQEEADVGTTTDSDSDTTISVSEVSISLHSPRQGRVSQDHDVGPALPQPELSEQTACKDGDVALIAFEEPEDTFPRNYTPQF